jgi:hypothetical protein
LFNLAQDFWKGLGSFWLHFENRPDLEAFWDGMLESLKESHRNLYKEATGKFPKHSPDVWNHKYINIDLIWSGIEDNRINETNYFSLPDEYIGTFSIPVLSGIYTEQVLTQGVDYKIVDANKLYIYNLISGLEADSRYTDDQRVSMFADHLYRIDPMTFNLLRPMADTELLVPGQEIYFPFTYDGAFTSGLETDHTYLIEQAKLIKYMTWAMFYYRIQKPSIANLEKLYNVLYNLPFAYEGGTADITGQECTIGDYTYYLPGSESWSISNGQAITRFQPLVSGVEIKDRVSHPSEIESEFGTLKDANSFILEVDVSSNSNYDNDFISKYEEDFINKAFNKTTTLI